MSMEIGWTYDRVSTGLRSKYWYKYSSYSWIDGDVSTKAQTDWDGGSDSNNWIEIDMGKIHNIEYIEIAIDA